MRRGGSYRIAHMGMLFAVALVLSFLESALVPLLGLMPAMKIGLANIVVMYALLFLGRGYACALVLLKALFAFLTRGFTAGVLSLLGGSASLLVLCLLLLWPGGLSGYLFSACGALAHNLGQLVGAAILLSSAAALGYAPVLMIAGLIMGGITWWLLKALLPYFAHLSAKNNQNPLYKKLR
ncbi:Gx transporter family protein [uncultured Gemmiger sp.]|uniref:Gx transporter family protein n=1 Tax=uncultured Gemmiger sp. TaxID=1623490 RepID=UPI0025ED9F83|nr:Gx transporter family protein [uncultured Gemmiger sp.]